MEETSKKCSCCKWLFERDVERRDESDRLVLDLVELPVKTLKKELILVGCPNCDGDLIEIANKRSV